jgi:hypothetical protein
MEGESIVLSLSRYKENTPALWPFFVCTFCFIFIFIFLLFCFLGIYCRSLMAVFDLFFFVF